MSLVGKDRFDIPSSDFLSFITTSYSNRQLDYKVREEGLTHGLQVV
jgi:hypothetical protein